jgi:ribonuclease T2
MIATSALCTLLFLLGTADARVRRDMPHAAHVPQVPLVSRELSCPADTPLSCSSGGVPPGVDKCCYEAPGGVLVLTQFWNYNPSLGPVDEFTLHGLWPDKCDGTYDASCNPSLNIKGSVESILVGGFGDAALYAYMKDNWKGLPDKGDEYLWTHEFNKHGTCVNTIHPDCYGAEFKPNQNIYDYLRIATELHKTLPTYTYLAAAGITPSASKTYTKAEIQAALDKGFGSSVYFACDGSALNEIWYFHHLQGSLLGQRFHALDALANGDCPASGIKYLPKSGAGPEPTTSNGNPDTEPTSTSTSKGTDPTTAPTSGNIKAGAHPGCLISAGKYFESGTCATFQLAGDSGIRSSKGPCAVKSGAFSCAAGNAPSAFTLAGGEIHVADVSDWCFGAAAGSPPQTAVLLAKDGACAGKETFKLTI